MKWISETDPNGWCPDTLPGRDEPITARDRARALYVLARAVAVRAHPYERDPQSGAGNCWCGDHQSAKVHAVELRP